MRTLLFLSTLFFLNSAFADYESYFGRLWTNEFPGKYWIIDLGVKPIEKITRERAIKMGVLNDSALQVFGHPMYQVEDFEIKYYLDKDFKKEPIVIETRDSISLEGVVNLSDDDFNRGKELFKKKHNIEIDVSSFDKKFPYQYSPLYRMPKENIRFTHGKLLALDVKDDVAETMIYGIKVYVNLKDLKYYRIRPPGKIYLKEKFPEILEEWQKFVERVKKKDVSLLTKELLDEELDSRKPYHFKKCIPDEIIRKRKESYNEIEYGLDKCDWDKLNKWVVDAKFYEWNIWEGYKHRISDSSKKELLKLYINNHPRDEKLIELENSIITLDFFSIDEELGITFALIEGKWRLTNLYNFQSP